MIRSKALIWLAGALIAGSVIAGWMAIGRLATATQRGLARTEESLSTTRQLATETASSATELRHVVGIVGEGLGSTVDALVATRQVSESVRGLLDLASIVDRVDELSEKLTAAEVSIARVEIDLAEASGFIEEVVPILDEVVTVLQTLPADLDRSIAEVESSRMRVGQQVWLWRLAIVAGGVALLVMLLLIVQLRGAVNASPPTGGLHGQP